MSPLVHVWWALYGFVPLAGALLTTGTALSSLSVTKTNDLDVAKMYTSNFSLQILVTVLSVAATATYALLVQNLTRRQRVLTGED